MEESVITSSRDERSSYFQNDESADVVLRVRKLNAIMLERAYKANPNSLKRAFTDLLRMDLEDEQEVDACSAATEPISEE